MSSKFLNISTDTTLGGNSPSDMAVSSQKAIKAYVDSQTGTAPSFANITGQPTDNTALATALNAKQDISNLVTSVSSSSTNSQYPSAKLFYDTVGDIETAINTIRGVS